MQGILNLLQGLGKTKEISENFVMQYIIKYYTSVPFGCTVPIFKKQQWQEKRNQKCVLLKNYTFQWLVQMLPCLFPFVSLQAKDIETAEGALIPQTRVSLEALVCI